MVLYHTGYQEIRVPDIRHGRINADFGQGFYMTADEEFARRWARERQDAQTIVNVYDLDLTGLCVRRFERDEKWFDYIFRNRAARPDLLTEADVIIGPIANDTIFDTFGIITSGLLPAEKAMKLLMIGPCYEQIVIKSQKAAGQLMWREGSVMTKEEVARFRDIVAEEEAEYQRLFAEEMQRL